VVPVETREPDETPADVCGSTTYSRDFVAQGSPLPAVRPGDLLAVLDVGAYGYCMASHFLNRPRPAEVFVDDGQALLVTRREEFEDLVRGQLEY
jgi:diaminopimelate decarboxylase